MPGDYGRRARYVGWSSPYHTLLHIIQLHVLTLPADVRQLWLDDEFVVLHRTHDVYRLNLRVSHQKATCVLLHQDGELEAVRVSPAGCVAYVAQLNSCGPVPICVMSL